MFRFGVFILKIVDDIYGLNNGVLESLLKFAIFVFFFGPKYLY